MSKVAQRQASELLHLGAKFCNPFSVEQDGKRHTAYIVRDDPMAKHSASFDVFLCHNSSEKRTVRRLGEMLKADGLTVWLDEWEIIPGRPWREALEEILSTAESAAVLVGKDGIGPWQDREISGCLSEFIDRGLPVIPVLLPGAPKEPGLPKFLQQLMWVDLRDGLTRDRIDRLIWGIKGTK